MIFLVASVGSELAEGIPQFAALDGIDEAALEFFEGQPGGVAVGEQAVEA
jgi:hypothetical protein